MTDRSSNHARRWWRDLRTVLRVPNQEFYDLGDWAAIRGVGIALWTLGTAITAVMLALAPPDRRGSSGLGWAAAGVVLLVAAVLTARLIRRPDTRPGEILAGSAFAVCGLAALGWFSRSQAYTGLMLLPVVYSAVVHPPRRATVVLALAVVLAMVFNSDHNQLSASTEVATQTVLWVGVGMMAMVWTATVRRVRRTLTEETRHERTRAETDPLTGLGNRRAFDQALATEMARAERTSLPLLLVAMDLDDFKRVNDEHGHLAGDRVLIAAAAVLRESSRAPDAWFRWGGDEFTGLYPATSAAEGEAIAHRLAQEMSRRAQRPDGMPLQARFGTAQWAPGMDAAELLHRADLEVLEAKRARGLRRYDSRDDEVRATHA